MNRPQRIIVSGITAFIICYFGYFIFISIKYRHHIEMNNYRRCLWLFSEKAKNDIDTNFYVGCVRDRDILSKYSYKNFNVFIWEFKDLDIVKLNEVHINQNTNLKDLKFSSKEILNKKNSPEINIKYGFTFNGTMSVNLDDYSKVESSFETNNYKGFYGVLNRMSFSNERDEHQIYFDYGFVHQPTLFLLYKGHGSFYVIIINSEKPFDESIINILNLQ